MDDDISALSVHSNPGTLPSKPAGGVATLGDRRASVARRQYIVKLPVVLGVSTRANVRYFVPTGMDEAAMRPLSQYQVPVTGLAWMVPSTEVPRNVPARFLK